MKIATSRLQFVLLTIGLAAGGAARGDPYWDADCHALKLKDASGVPQGSEHSYEFVGTCNINIVKDSGPSVMQTVPAVAKGVWNGPAKTFEESFKVLGEVHIPGQSITTSSSIFGSTSVNLSSADISSGAVSSIFQCNDDPLVSSAACLLSQHSNNSGFEPFSNPAVQQHRPLLKGKTTLAEATDLSKKHVQTVTPAQWPEQKKPVPTAKAGSGTPVNVGAIPPGQLNLPPNPIRGSGGFVPNSGQRSAAAGAPALAMREAPHSPASAVGEANLGPAAAAATKLPPVEIIAVTSKTESNCKPPQPAASVNVTIRNNNTSPTGPGTLYLKEAGGANLNGSLQLPGLAAGQTAPVVSAPLTTATPYSKLAGSHQIAVYSAYKGVKYDKEPVMSTPTRMVTVTFPPGHCVVQRQTGPAAGGSARAKP